MKQIIILGAGTSGTIMANKLNKALDHKSFRITIIDKNHTHYYQPGFLLLPFGVYKPAQLKKPIHKFIPANVELVIAEPEQIVHDENIVKISDGRTFKYDLLIIATGTDIAPHEVEGMSGPHWHEDIFDFYTFDGAVNLGKKLESWDGGKLVVHISEMPIKCPVAPLEFAFLADSYFKTKGMRDKVSITYVTPMDAAFTKPRAAEKLNYLLDEKAIQIVTDFYIERVDGIAKKIYDYEGREVEYDLLVTVPTNMGDPLIARSGLGDELNFVPTNKHTLQAKAKENIFVIGDATNLPTSKAGSVAHFEAEILTENILSYLKGEPLSGNYDGHANCFVETGNGKALLIDFNYEQEPVTGTFPLPGIGPLKLLKETKMNHQGKLAFRWIYWNLLLKARPIPFVTANMKLAGKDIEPNPTLKSA